MPRSEIAATLQEDPPRDKFLVQATSLPAEVFASIQAKPHKEQTDDVSNIWTTVEKESMFQKKLITSFTSKPAATGSSPATMEQAGSNDPKGGAAAPAPLDMATAGSSRDGPPADQRPESVQAELALLRKKYDDLVAFTINLTAERDILAKEIASAKAETAGADGAASQLDDTSVASAAEFEKQLSQTGARFSLNQLVVVTVFAFIIGRLLGS